MTPVSICPDHADFEPAYGCACLKAKLSLAEKKLADALWEQVVRCIALHHPIGVHDNELSEYGQGARDALRSYKKTLRGEWERVLAARLRELEGRK